MLKRVEKSETIFLQEKGGKKRYLWAFIDEMGCTIIQVYSEKFPTEMEKYIKNDKTNSSLR